MTKTELTQIAKRHNAEVVCNKRDWGFYYIPEDKMQSFSKCIIDGKASMHSSYVKESKAFSVTVTLK